MTLHRVPHVEVPAVPMALVAVAAFVVTTAVLEVYGWLQSRRG